MTLEPVGYFPTGWERVILHSLPGLTEFCAPPPVLNCGGRLQSWNSRCVSILRLTLFDWRNRSCCPTDLTFVRPIGSGRGVGVWAPSSRSTLNRAENSPYSSFVPSNSTDNALCETEIANPPTFPHSEKPTHQGLARKIPGMNKFPLVSRLFFSSTLNGMKNSLTILRHSVGSSRRGRWPRSFHATGRWAFAPLPGAQHLIRRMDRAHPTETAQESACGTIALP